MDFKPYIIIQIIFLAFVLAFIVHEIRITGASSSKEKKLAVYTLLILFIGVLLRSINLSYPHGVFVDEAMGAYDSWSLANYGVDSNLASYPVYLKSWGTGQSALYAYLALPFIKLFGLNVEAYRLPMSLISCLALIVLYKTLKKSQQSGSLVFCITAFLAINPWHIIKSRFAVDCNICPDLVLIGICLIILSIYTHRRKTGLTVAGFSLLALSAYGYGVSWMVLPFIFIGGFLYLYRKKYLSVKQEIIAASISFLILLPLILFAFTLFFKLEQFTIGPVTITQLSDGRHNDTTLFGSGRFIQQFLLYLKYAYKVVVLGIDNLNVSSLPVSGIFYNIISLPFLILGIYKGYKEKSVVNDIFLIWLISCLPILLIVEPTINHWNLLWFPVIYFTGYGIFKFIEIGQTNFVIVGSIYSISFLLFLRNYFDREVYKPFNSYTFEKEIKFTKDHHFNKIFYPKDFTHSYTLFYTPVSPYIFAKTFVSDGHMLSTGLSYANISFGLPDIQPISKTAYVISNQQLPSIDLNLFRIQKGEYYSVLWND